MKISQYTMITMTICSESHYFNQKKIKTVHKQLNVLFSQVNARVTNSKWGMRVNLNISVGSSIMKRWQKLLQPHKLSCPGRGGGERGWNHVSEKSPAAELLTNGFFTDEAVHHRRARVGFQAGHCSPLQVRAEPRIVRLAWEPLQCGVCKCGHVFPSPVGYIDLAQAYPR